MPIEFGLLPCLYAFAAIYGIAWVIAYAKISVGFRRAIEQNFGPRSKWLALAECPICQSFWYALFVGTVIFQLGVIQLLAFAFAQITASVVLTVASHRLIEEENHE